MGGIFNFINKNRLNIVFKWTESLKQHGFYTVNETADFFSFSCVPPTDFPHDV